MRTTDFNQSVRLRVLSLSCACEAAVLNVSANGVTKSPGMSVGLKTGEYRSDAVTCRVGGCGAHAYGGILSVSTPLCGVREAGSLMDDRRPLRGRSIEWAPDIDIGC